MDPQSCNRAGIVTRLRYYVRTRAYQQDRKSNKKTKQVFCSIMCGCLGFGLFISKALVLTSFMAIKQDCPKCPG